MKEHTDMGIAATSSASRGGVTGAERVSPSRPEDRQVVISPVRLNHAVLFVSDLDRSVDFYAGVFGMEVIAREPRANAAFLRLPRSGNHHDLGLFGVGTAGGPKRSGAIGLYHLAWQLDTIDELEAARRVLIDAGSYTGESSHGATKSLYGADPDGNEFEIMWMLPRDQWGPYEKAAPIDHLDLDAEVRRWSGIATAGHLAFDPDEAAA
jgi:catechol-2,3-dioxygenase